MELLTQPNLDAPDDFYEALIETHRDLSPSRATPSTRDSSCCLPTTSAGSRS